MTKLIQHEFSPKRREPLLREEDLINRSMNSYQGPLKPTPPYDVSPTVVGVLFGLFLLGACVLVWLLRP